MLEKATRKLKAKVVPVDAKIDVEKKSTVGESLPSTTSKTEALGEFMFDQEPAVVELEYGLTLNLGNFESARISVSVRMPCKPQDVDATFKTTKDWVTQRVVHEIAEIRGFAKNQGSY